jgi:hypothetical protein
MYELVTAIRMISCPHGMLWRRESSGSDHTRTNCHGHQVLRSLSLSLSLCALQMRIITFSVDSETHIETLFSHTTTDELLHEVKFTWESTARSLQERT